MSDTPKVEIGQVWQDYDIRRRAAAGMRLILVTYVSTMLEMAEVVTSYDDGQTWNRRRTRIRLARFKPTSTGYRFLNRDKVDVLKHGEL